MARKIVSIFMIMMIFLNPVLSRGVWASQGISIEMEETESDTPSKRGALENPAKSPWYQRFIPSWGQKNVDDGLSQSLEEATENAPPQSRLDRCIGLCDGCSVGTWIILDPIFGWSSAFLNTAGSVLAFIAPQLEKENADYAHYASAGCSFFAAILGSLKIIAASHKEAHIQKALDRLPDDAQKQRGILMHFQNHSDQGALDNDPETPTVNWASLPGFFGFVQDCLGCYHALSFAGWTMAEGPLGFGAVLCSTLGSIFSGVIPQTKKGVREAMEWTAFALDGLATLCSALKHYATIRQETEADRLEKTYGIDHKDAEGAKEEQE